MGGAKRRLFVGEQECADFAKCRYCPASIVWVITDRGKRMPLDYDSREPTLGGGWMLEPHWGNCPGADEARQRAGRGRGGTHREVH